MDRQDTTLSLGNCFPDFDMENYIRLWTSFPCPNLEGNRDLPGLKETYTETSAAQPEMDIAGPLPSEESLVLPDEFLEFLQERQAQEQSPCRNVLPPSEIQDPTLSTTEKVPCKAAGPDPLPCPLPEAREEGEEQASSPVKTKKRAWVRFSPYQRQALMERFKVNRKLTSKDVKDLSSQLGLSPKQIWNWFRNEKKRFKKWFPLLLNGEQEADSKSVQKMNEGWSVKSGVGVTLQLPCPMPEVREEREELVSSPVKKREWVRFSPYQKQALMERFKVNRELTSEDVKDLSSQLGLSPKQVWNWFQNERKRFKKRFSLLLNGEQGADSKSVQKMNEGWSVKSGVGVRLQLPCPMPEAREEREELVSSPVKKKREWVRFSPYQKQALMERFKVNRKLTSEDVEDLSSQLGLTSMQVRTWFRNERKKFKKWLPLLLNGEQEADPKRVQGDE